MKDYAINDELSADKHFRQAGYNIYYLSNKLTLSDTENLHRNWITCNELHIISSSTLRGWNI